MKLQFIGTGSAFTVGTDNYHSNMLLHHPKNDACLMIDCGTDARHALHALNLSHAHVQDVYISHLHADHAAGLEWLGFATKFDPRCPKPRLYLCDVLIHDLWHRVLSGGMDALGDEPASLSSFFQVCPVDPSVGFVWQDIHFKIIETLHVQRMGNNVPSFGLLFTINQWCILITTDTQFTPDRFSAYYEQADCIFHECETAPLRSGVHAHYADLVTLDPNIKRKMWLYHYNPGVLPDAVSDGFLGFVKRGQVFDF